MAMWSVAAAVIALCVRPGATAGCLSPDSTLLQMSLADNASSRPAWPMLLGGPSCTVCPDIVIFSECPGNNQANCPTAGSVAPGCEWCPLTTDCRVKCTCNDDSHPQDALYRDCTYDFGTGLPQTMVKIWPPVLAPAYTSWDPQCECPVGGKGDPHMSNVHGQSFDLMQPGTHALLHVPKLASANDTLLRVDAKAEDIGAACEDMYFTDVNVTGAWVAHASGAGPEGLRFLAGEDGDPSKRGWWHFQKVDLKIVHGHTKDGVAYLNFQARNLRSTGYAVGGLLGEDDHTKAATPLPGCRKTVSLLNIA